MKIQALGHVALNVSDRVRAEQFYNGVLGLPISGHLGADVTFFAVNGDQFQDLAVTEVRVPHGSDDKAAEPSPGLSHVAFRVGDCLDDLRAAITDLQAHGIAVSAPIDHTWSNSVYLRDPDGNGVELYVEISDTWKTPGFEPTATKIEI